MNQLIVVAHPKADSFSQKLKYELEKKLVEQSHVVKVRDLYLLNFDPILTDNELKRNKLGEPGSDIIIEQNHLNWADEVTFIYPLWWNAFPAILKGYIDRVFTNGFAFKINANGPEGLLKGKKVKLITTAGMTAESLESSNIYEGLRITQEHGVFEFCGMEVIDHMYVTRVTSLNAEEKQEALDQLLQEIFEKERVSSE